MKSKKLPVILAIIAILLVVFFGVQALSGGDEPDDPVNPVVDPVTPEDPGNEGEYVEYTFRNSKLLEEHFQKHGIEMGFATEEEYQKAASDVANNPDALHKLEKDDKDDVYYLEETNEFVVISTDGFIRTYFCPDSGKKYFDKQ
ncbi:MAG: hypothetical protein IJL49_03720 [Firmicutes bacterium]|nr:hypothetical protein [Bacillota bacterium]